MIKRVFDFFFSFFLLLIFLIPLIFIMLAIIFVYRENPLFWSKRYKENSNTFYMPKIKTMISGAPDIASHLLDDPEKYITKIGKILRRYSVDEIPQLFSILKGDMSFVGPRPALHNQYDLIALRDKFNISYLKPGLTGWAQINGRDNLSIENKILYEKEYSYKKSFMFDLKIIFITIKKVIMTDKISH